MIISIEKNLVSRYNTDVQNYNTEIHVSVRKIKLENGGKNNER